MGTHSAHRRGWKWTAVSWAVLGVGLGLSVLTGGYWRHVVHEQGRETFRRASADTAARIGTTIRRTADLTAAASAFAAARPDVDNQEFERWFERLGGEERHRSVLALSLVEKVGPEGLQAYFDRARRDPVFATTPFPAEVVPPGERPQYCFASARVVTDPALNVPPNLDICAVLDGRLAYNRDRVAGDTDLTFVKFTLPPADGDREPREWLAVSTPDGPYDEVPGIGDVRSGVFAVASVVDLDEVIGHSLGERPGFSVSLLYHPSGREWERMASVGERPKGKAIRHTVSVVAEDEWRVEVTAPASMFDRSADKQGAALAASLALASLLFFTLIRVLAGSRAKALTLVDARTADLATSEARFRLLASSAPIGVAYGDAEGRCLFVNERMASILGRSPADICAAGWQSSFDENDRSRFANLREEAVELQIAASGRWLRIRTASLPGDGGQVASIEDVSDSVAVREKLRHEARHDMLTGLPNRASLIESLDLKIDRIADMAGHLAVVFIDLDRFKQVNDGYGHAAGDELLVQAGRRLARSVRPGDVAARLGGDEFAVMMPDVEGQEALVGILSRVEGALCAPYEVFGAEVVVGASIGVVMVDDDQEDAESLLRDADMAMYRAKQGSGRFEIFEPSLRDGLFARVETERALRAALDMGELAVHYQPILALDGEAIAGAEALLRWEHPTRGLLLPADFLPIAESTGLIVPIGDWVLKSALAAAATWPPETMVSVNLSAQQLAASNVLGDMGGALSAAGIAPERLCIEVLESHLVDDFTLERVTALKQLGVQIAIDDFGTGFNSLVNLKRFPVDRIKIDRGFVEGLSDNRADAEIVSKLVELAHALGIVVVAEGVETRDQAHLLRAAGCDFAQGFLWSVAVPASELEQQLLTGVGQLAPR